MIVTLPTNQENPALSLSAIERYSDGSGYASLLSVRSGNYSAEYKFYFEDQSLEAFVTQLEGMDSLLTGTARLQPLYEPQYIQLACDNSGRVLVSGDLPEHDAHGQRLTFAFQTDQTVLKPLISSLRAVLALAKA